MNDALNTSSKNNSDPECNWSIWRQGDDGNQFMIESGLTEEDAKKKVADFEAHGHKQLYWASQNKASHAEH